ncbi:ABC transporter substrate-binding protein [Nocardia miyunensis]|uniref:ABC transporter substrate-binding protein n=1 Tax=Nocardia miyunensis TaxID=282684 RepID=UPI000B2F31DB|nr:ABC transporter substrate-binding protein [Nocardia miyunensis]
MSDAVTRSAAGARAALSRRGFLGLSVAAAGAGAAACAGMGGGGVQGGDPNNITFWSNHPGTSKRRELAMIDAFQAAHPGLRVTLVDAGKNYEEVSTKFNAALIGGQLPDIVVLSDVWWFNFAINKAITPLDQYFGDAGVRLDDYVDTFVNDYQFQGKHYALPYARSTQIFCYNQDVWAKAGLPQRGPQSWAEFDEWGPKIQSLLGPNRWAHGWYNATNNLSWTFQGPMWTFGGAYSDGWTLKFTDPATIAAGNALREMVNVKRYASIRPQAATDFGTGVIASAITSTGDLAGINANAKGKLSFATDFLPHPGGPGCTTGGAGLAIPERISDERKVNALRFIEFITDATNTATFAQSTGYIPVRKSARQDPSEVAFLAENPNFRTALNQLPLTKSQDYGRVFLPGADQIIGTGLEQIGLRNQDVYSVMSSVQNQMHGIYTRQVAPKLPK